MTIDQVNNLIFISIIAGQVFVVAGSVYLLFFRKYQNKLIKLITKNAIPLAFLVALIATGSSLYYSEIIGFTPCELCWIQRIFIYPQVILLGLAWIKKEKLIIDYSLILLAIGTGFSLYHNYIYYTVQSTGFCSLISPCTQDYVTGFGYITIPLMALTSFLLIGVLLIISKLRKYV